MHAFGVTESCKPIFITFCDFGGESCLHFVAEIMNGVNIKLGVNFSITMENEQKLLRFDPN